jgi:hypothetical protein
MGVEKKVRARESEEMTAEQMEWRFRTRTRGEMEEELLRQQFL